MPENFQAFKIRNRSLFLSLCAKKTNRSLLTGDICKKLLLYDHYLKFPTIYGIALENVDEHDTTLGAAFLVMAIVGGALMPPLQGMLIDMKTIAGLPAVNASYIIPLVCFVVVTLYGFYTKQIKEKF